MFKKIVNYIQKLLDVNNECNSNCKHYGKFATELEYNCSCICNSCKRNYMDKFEQEVKK